MDMTDNFLDQLAVRIRAAVPPRSIPNDDVRALFRMYAVLLLAKGESVSAADVHNAWVAWMLDVDPSHESLIEFQNLSPDVAREDEAYVQAIQGVARELRSTGSHS